MNPTAAPAPGQSVPARIRGRLAWWVIRTAGGASRGLSLGLRHGFASSASMDPLYTNQPAGFTKVGRWLDRVYLRSPGAKALRWREQALRRRVVSLLGKHRENESPVSFSSPSRPVLLDLGCGSGRLMRAIHDDPRFRDAELSAVLIDHDPEALSHARDQLEQAPSLPHIRFVNAQAATPQDWSAAPASVDVAVTAGLLELLSDDDVRTIAAGMARVVKPGGAWVVTAMLWHPDESLVRRCLAHVPSQHGEAPQGPTNRCVFSLRSCEALSELLASEGWAVGDWERSPTGITAVGVAVPTEEPQKKPA